MANIVERLIDKILQVDRCERCISLGISCLDRKLTCEDRWTSLVLERDRIVMRTSEPIEDCPVIRGQESAETVVKYILNRRDDLVEYRKKHVCLSSNLPRDLVAAGRMSPIDYEIFQMFWRI